jgi:5,10-methylenetetrahydrofolate reductase
MAAGLFQTIEEAVGKGTPFYSFEVFPPSTVQGLDALYVVSQRLFLYY